MKLQTVRRSCLLVLTLGVLGAVRADEPKFVDHSLLIAP